MQYFEDIEVGRVVELGRHTVTREEIISFARQWDPQPFHLDEGAAGESLLGGLTASSCHTYAITSLIFAQVPNPLAAGAMMGITMRFPTPVRPGDTLTLRSACVEKRLSRSRAGFGVVTSHITLLNQRAEETCVIESSYLVRCTPEGVGG